MNFKKLLIVLISAMLVASLCACGNTVRVDAEENDGRMMIVYNDGVCLIYVDTETGCQYLSRTNCGTCLMVDADGQPLLYDVED